MLGLYPTTFTLVQIHLGDSYATAWGNARSDFYNPGIQYTPDAFFDGVYQETGASNVSEAQARYTNRYNQRRAVPCDVTIQLTGTPAGGYSYTIRARVCIEAGGTAKNMRIYIAQVLDHYPKTPSYSRHCFRRAATTQDVSLSPGGCQVVERTLTFDATDLGQQSDIKIIAWAQEPQANGWPTDRAEVYQAAAMNWPFVPDCNGNGIPDPLDIASGYSQDCNSNGVPDECDLTSGTSQDCQPNGIPDECDIASGYSEDLDLNGIPDECEYPKGDMNCDLLVNFADINAFVVALQGPDTYFYYYPNCVWLNGDFNGDNLVNFADINLFVAALSGK